jgi:probable F420-dependent oxidoreductase
MKWGIVFASTGFPDPAAAVALAETAEAVGFESLWAPEHVIMSRVPDATPYRGVPDGRMDRLARRGGIPDPLIWFAYVASATSTIKFGTGVLIVPEHQPVPLAKRLATLDHLAGGRVLLGVGVGELPEEYHAVGMDFADRGRRMDEYLEALRILWREDVASYHGRYVDFDQVECRPWPPGRAIPIHVGGASPAAVRRAGRVGDGYFPFVFPGEDLREVLPRAFAAMRREAEAADRDPDAIEITSGGARTPGEAEWYAEQGVHRLTVAVRARTTEEMRDEVARLAEELVRPTADW